MFALGYAIFAAAAPKPHIVMMLGDDHGFNNVGWRNPEIRSPNMDHLVNEGVVLERHYTYKVCSPTRSSLMSGRLPYHVNENNACNRENSASGIDLRMTLLPQKLKQAHYLCHMAGKWHGGARSAANLPINRGFDSHLGFLKGGEDHWNQHSDNGGGAVDLWMDHGPAFGMNGTYSTEIYAPRAVEIISKHDASQPLFLYLPWHVTHTPLEAPDSYLYPSLPAYNNSFDARMKLNAMVRIMDEGIGNVTNALKARGMWSTTLMVYRWV